MALKGGPLRLPWNQIQVLEFMDDFAEALGLDLLQRETLLHHLGVEDAELVEAKKVGVGQPFQMAT